jgi:hypothetical protein
MHWLAADAAVVEAVVVEVAVGAGVRERVVVVRAVVCLVAAADTVVGVAADIAAVAAHLRCRDRALVRRR